MVLGKMIEKFGLENCLVIIGSANVINERTPYTFEERKKMILKLFPKIKILPMADVGNNEIWLENLKKMEGELNTKFVFYGGSQADMEILSQRFETEVLVDRFTEGKGISGTEIRKSL